MTCPAPHVPQASFEAKTPFVAFHQTLVEEVKAADASPGQVLWQSQPPQAPWYIHFLPQDCHTAPKFQLVA